MRVEVKVIIKILDQKEKELESKTTNSNFESEDLIKLDLNLLLISESPTDYKDVHIFDSKYDHDIKPRFDKSEKLQKFEKMKSEMKIICTTSNFEGFDMIINGIDTRQNLDPLNNLRADDVLVEIYEILLGFDLPSKASIYNLILESLEDMKTLGPCPQGRTTRLYQIYSAIKG